MISKPTCSATTKAGKPCTFPPLSGSTPPVCFNHASGDKAEVAKAKARKAGGKLRGATQKGARITSPPVEKADSDDSTPPDPADFCTKRDREKRNEGRWWWWGLRTAGEATAGLKYTMRAVIAGTMTVNQARAITATAKAMAPGLPHQINTPADDDEDEAADLALAGYTLADLEKKGVTVDDLRTLDAAEILANIGHVMPDDEDDEK